MLIPFAPPPGLISDQTTFKNEGRWSDGRNVRFVNGSPKVMGRWAELLDTGSEAVYGLFVIDRSGTPHLAYGTPTKLYVGSGIAAPSDRTPASMGSGYSAYAFGAWGDQILFVPSGGTLYEQSGTSQATVIANAPDAITWMLVTPQRQVLAFGCNEESSGTFNGRCIRGSDLEDYTDWTTSATNNAFEHILDGGGKIVTARLIGQYVAVWTETALHLGQFVGDPSQTYRFDRVAENCGCIGRRAVAVVGQRAYWLGYDLQLRTWAPGGEVEVIPCPIQRALSYASGYSSGSDPGTSVVYNPKHNEIWVHPGTGRDSFNVCLNGFSWWRADYGAGSSRSAFLCDDLIEQIASINETNIIAADAGGKVYSHECGFPATAAGPTSWYLQSGDFRLDNGQRRAMIRGIIPDFSVIDIEVDPPVEVRNEQSVSLTLFVRDRPQSTATTKGPYTITAAATKKDFRASGKLVAVKLGQTTSIDYDMVIGTQTFDVVPLGER
jgi:hypothetical protein